MRVYCGNPACDLCRPYIAHIINGVNTLKKTIDIKEQSSECCDIQGDPVIPNFVLSLDMNQ